MRSILAVFGSVILCLISIDENLAQCPVPAVIDANNTCTNPQTSLSLWAQTTDTSCGVTSISHKWYTSSMGSAYINGTVVPHGGTCAIYQTRVDVSESTSFWVSAVINGCESPRVKVTAVVSTNYTPVLALQPSVMNDGTNFYGSFFCMSGSEAVIKLNASGGFSGEFPAQNNIYQWYDAAEGGTLLAVGPNYFNNINYSSTDNGYRSFWVGGILYNSLGCAFPVSPRRKITIRLLPYPNCVNAVDRYVSFDENITDMNGILSAPSSLVRLESSYLDGLGRPLQQVVRGGSPSGFDVVQPVTYDRFGRPAKVNLPVVSGEANGFFKMDIVDQEGNYTGSLSNFYSDPNDLIADDPKPYSLSVFEPSPLNRISRQGAVGEHWQPTPGANHYANLNQTWNYREFLLAPTAGGGSVTAKIEDNLLTISFSGGFNASKLKTGPVKRIPSSDLIPDMVLGPIAMGNYSAEIKDGLLTVLPLSSNAVSVTGFGMSNFGSTVTFLVDLVPESHAIAIEYLSNGPNEVLKWSFDSATGQITSISDALQLDYYASGSLSVRKTEDGNGMAICEYVDREGRTILKKAELVENAILANDAHWAQTYYIYDDFGNLVLVLPPEAVKALLDQ